MPTLSAPWVCFPLSSTRGQYKQPETGGRGQSLGHPHTERHRPVFGHLPQSGIPGGENQG